MVDFARSCSVVRASTFVLPVALSQEFLEKELFLQPNQTCAHATAWVLTKSAIEVRRKIRNTGFDDGLNTSSIGSLPGFG
jgi:hypothetical protein